MNSISQFPMQVGGNVINPNDSQEVGSSQKNGNNPVKAGDKADPGKVLECSEIIMEQKQGGVKVNGSDDPKMVGLVRPGSQNVPVQPQKTGVSGNVQSPIINEIQNLEHGEKIGWQPQEVTARGLLDSIIKSKNIGGDIPEAAFNFINTCESQELRPLDEFDKVLKSLSKEELEQLSYVFCSPGFKKLSDKLNEFTKYDNLSKMAKGNRALLHYYQNEFGKIGAFLDEAKAKIINAAKEHNVYNEFYLSGLSDDQEVLNGVGDAAQSCIDDIMNYLQGQFPLFLEKDKEQSLLNVCCLLAQDPFDEQSFTEAVQHYGYALCKKGHFSESFASGQVAIGSEFIDDFRGNYWDNMKKNVLQLLADKKFPSEGVAGRVLSGIKYHIDFNDKCAENRHNSSKIFDGLRYKGNDILEKCNQISGFDDFMRTLKNFFITVFTFGAVKTTTLEDDLFIKYAEDFVNSKFSLENHLLLESSYNKDYKLIDVIDKFVGEGFWQANLERPMKDKIEKTFCRVLTEAHEDWKKENPYLVGIPLAEMPRMSGDVKDVGVMVEHFVRHLLVNSSFEQLLLDVQLLESACEKELPPNPGSGIDLIKLLEKKIGDYLGGVSGDKAAKNKISGAVRKALVYQLTENKDLQEKLSYLFKFPENIVITDENIKEISEKYDLTEKDVSKYAEDRLQKEHIFISSLRTVFCRELQSSCWSSEHLNRKLGDKYEISVSTDDNLEFETYVMKERISRYSDGVKRAENWAKYGSKEKQVAKEKQD